jgi:hypothetical protein
VIRRGVVIQQETVAAAGEAAAEAHKAQMEVSTVRSMQTVSEGTATDTAQTELTDAARTEAEVAEARRSVEQGLQPRQDNEGNRRQFFDDEDQLARALAESQADSERQKLTHEADRRVMRMVTEASELDTEQRKAEEDKVAAVVSESKLAAEVCEAIATEEAVRLAWSNDPETVVQMQAQVAGLPTQDIEEFREKIAEVGTVELQIPSDGDCFYHAVNASLAGTRISSSMTADELWKQIVPEAMKRGEIDQDEAEQRSKQGELVTHDEIQTAANTLRCRIVIYHARPAPSEPDKDIVSPEGNRRCPALRDI